MDKRLITTSKFLSLVLRHDPERIGISLDSEGWVEIEVLLAACMRHSQPITRDELSAVVESNDKQRFVVRDGRIRANQGHSIDVELHLDAHEPPSFLYHGTSLRFMDTIRFEGLKKMNRQHVHLSSDSEAALSVGRRHGKPIVLLVKALAMDRAGHEFFLSENGVWLTDHVPWAYLEEFRSNMR